MYSTLLRAAALAGGLALTGCRALQDLGGLSFDGAGGGGGGAIGAEDCTDGEDNDGDGLVDCADPSCTAAGYACVAAPPSGWSGPIALYEGSFTEPVPTCPALYPELDYQGDTGPDAQPATCEECACAAAEITCTVELTFFKNGNCKGSTTKSDPLTAGGCVKLDAGASSLSLSKPTSTVQPCTPSGGAATIPALQRTTSGIACGASRRTGGCSTGEICAPRPQAPFHEARCISRDAAKSCPASYPVQHHLEQIKDDRGCSPCACGAPALPSCAATTTLFSDDACGVQSTSSLNDGSCVTSMPASATAAVTGSGTADCAPQGSTPTGSVTIASQATICCSE
jgi:hypothetical protein